MITLDALAPAVVPTVPTAPREGAHDDPTPLPPLPPSPQAPPAPGSLGPGAMTAMTTVLDGVRPVTPAQGMPAAMRTPAPAVRPLPPVVVPLAPARSVDEEGLMRLRLPAKSTKTLPTGAAELLAALQEAALDPPREGYLHLVHDDKDVVVFFYAGKPFQAGVFAEDRFGPMPLSELPSALRNVRAAELATTDLALFLCGAVLFRKAPAAHIPAALVDGETVLKNIRALGKDAVVVIQRGAARSLCFCRGGKPVALYTAPGEDIAATGPIADRIVEYVYAHGGAVTLDLYDDIQLQQSPDAGEPLEAFLVQAVTPPATSTTPPPSLIVRLGERVVFRFPVMKDETFIGRGDDVDLVLDNLSVSRRHARVIRDGRSLTFHDLESENGLVVDGARRGAVTLQPGDAVQVGKYTLVSSHYAVTAAEAAAAIAPQSRARSPIANVDTMTLPRATKPVALEFEGKQHKLAGAVFTIGRSSSANLRIGGLFVADTHVVLARDGEGWRATHTNGWRAMEVNGRKTRQAQLHDGDVLVVAGQSIVFCEPD